MELTLGATEGRGIPVPQEHRSIWMCHQRTPPTLKHRAISARPFVNLWSHLPNCLQSGCIVGDEYCMQFLANLPLYSHKPSGHKLAPGFVRHQTLRQPLMHHYKSIK